MSANVREIVADWLRANGYGGLYLPECCACSVDDLMPCSQPNPQCAAGHVMPCCECANQDDCGNGMDFDYLIVGEGDTWCFEPIEGAMKR